MEDIYVYEIWYEGLFVGNSGGESFSSRIEAEVDANEYIENIIENYDFYRDMDYEDLEIIIYAVTKETFEKGW